MANIKSAKKRIKVTAIKTERNKAAKSRIKTCTKKVEAFVADGNKNEADASLKEVTSLLQRAARKGIYHKNNASRKISRLSKLVGNMA